MHSTTLATLSLTAFAALTSAYKITIHNNCTETIWPAAQQFNWQNVQPYVEMDAKYHGAVLDPEDTFEIEIPTRAIGVRVWARTGCDAECSTCQTGQCGGGLMCEDPALTSNMILAEFGAGLDAAWGGTGMTFYDLSIQNEHNIAVQLIPTDTTCSTKTCLDESCAKDQAWHSADDAALGSPADTGCSNESDYDVYYCPS